MSNTKRIAFAVIVMLLVIPTFVFSRAGTEDAGSERYPVPRKDTVVVETDTNYANFETANDYVPRGTQWGSGWHQVVTEWDWYINYATGDVILWRTTGWEYSTDQKQLTWHVRKGVKWNDGEPYTANDYVFTFEMLMADPGLGASTHVENVASVEAVDDYTLLIKFKNPEYRFHHKLRMWGGIIIAAKHKWEGTETREYKNWPPVETGPYMFHSFSEDLGLFVWERNKDYWGNKVHKKSPGPKYVIFRMAPPPDLDLAEFIEGAIDMTLPHIFTIEMIRSAQKKTEHVVVAPFMDVVSQGICSYNCAKYPTSLPEFRWAVQYLVNREKHAKIYPMAEKSFPTMWPWPDYGSLDKWEVPAIKAKYGEQLRYDPAAAEKALDDLGFKKGSDGIRKTPKGDEFILTLVTRSSPDLGFLHAQDLSDEMRKIGIQTNMRAVDAGIWGDLVNNGDYDISFDVLSTDTAFPNDPWLFFNSYHIKHVKPIGEYQTSGDRGRSRLESPELDAVADKMAVTPPDSPEYLDLVEQGLDIWYQNLPAVPVVEKVFVQTFSDMYWTGWPDEDNMYHVPYQWWPEIMFVLFELKPAK